MIRVSYFDMVSKKQNKKIHIQYTIATVLVLCVILFFIARASFGAYQKMRASTEKRHRAEQTQNELQARLDSLSKKVEYLDTERGLEEEIRSKFNVAKEGEEVFVIVGDEGEKSISASTTQSVLSRFWNWITFWN